MTPIKYFLVGARFYNRPGIRISGSGQKNTRADEKKKKISQAGDFSLISQEGNSSRKARF